MLDHVRPSGPAASNLVVDEDFGKPINLGLLFDLIRREITCRRPGEPMAAKARNFRRPRASKERD